nr:hypothetical protein [Vibrio splendidus]MCC4880428.1 hypothetical protein [Vibrio splendidus]
MAKNIIGFFFAIFCFALGLVAFYAYLTDNDIGEYTVKFIDLVKPLGAFLIELIIDLFTEALPTLLDLNNTPEEIPLSL